MSEYRWRVRDIWVGVDFQLPEQFPHSVYHNRVLAGVIRRSGVVRALGHFCFVELQYLGKKRTASGAEDRIYPFHSLKLEVAELPQKLELVHLGWCADKNTPAFLDVNGDVVEPYGSGAGARTKKIDPILWQEKWRDPGYRSKAWQLQGMLHADEEALKILQRRKKHHDKERQEA